MVSSNRSFIGGLAHESAVNRGIKSLITLMQIVTRENFVSSLDRFAKAADLRDSVDSILTHVYPYHRL